MPNLYLKQTVIDWLNTVDYADDLRYIPSSFALEFINFIKMVNGSTGEEHATPVTHLRMLDNVHGPDQKIINMCFRGAAKTAVLGEYLFLYIAVYGKIPGFGKINLALYVSDSIENGVKNMRKNLEFRWENSDFLQRYIPAIRFTDIRWEFTNIDRNKFIVKGYGAKALSLDTEVIMLDGSRKTIKDVQVGEYIMTPRGYQTEIIEKSVIFNRPMYKITLEDGRALKVCVEHLNSVTIKLNPNNKAIYRDVVFDTYKLLELDLQHVRIRKRKGRSPYVSRENLVFMRNTEPVQYRSRAYDIDPYTLGLLIGNGSIKKDGSNILHCRVDDFSDYILRLPDNLGEPYLDKRNSTVVSIAIKGISKHMKRLGLQGHVDDKFIPGEYLIGGIGQRRELLRGLMDTDGSIQKNGRMHFYSNSERLVDDVSSLVRSLGGTTKKRKQGNAFRIEVWIDVNPFAILRKANRFTNYRVKSLVAISSIIRIADEPSQCLKVSNQVSTDIISGEYTTHEPEFLVNDYIRTHNTGVRGAKEMGVRPQLAILDDLISDEDARSDTVIKSIEATVNKAVNFALHPTHSKIIWSGTPFNAKDPLYKAVESGAWKVNVFPICNQFPCEKKDFHGAWEDRFPYSYVKGQYDFAMAQGKISDFNQELMLRIMSEEDRLVNDGEILWYDRSKLLANKTKFNFYITTDFATSGKQSADFSVIMVWAVNSKGMWFLVDGLCKRQTMDKNINDLFRLAQIYNPQAVGVEVSGQQGGFIPWIQGQMLERSIWFTLASDHNKNDPGIRPNTNKMVRFNIVVPWFKSHIMFFPKELKDTPFMVEVIAELSLVSVEGFKSKNDDCLDSISMLPSLTVWRPSEAAKMTKSRDDMWEIEEEDLDDGALESYVV